MLWGHYRTAVQENNILNCFPLQWVTSHPNNTNQLSRTGKAVIFIFYDPSVEISNYSLFLPAPRHSNHSIHLLPKLDPRDRPVTRQKNMAFIGILKDKFLHGLVSESTRRGLTLFPIHLDKGFAGLDKISWDTSLVWHPAPFRRTFSSTFSFVVW